MTTRLPGLSATITGLALLAGPGPAIGGEPAPGWDVAAAGRHLDERATAWFAFAGADRGRGADKVSCVSCHTLLPYALARPVLRRSAGDAKPTAHEAKVVTQVGRRVAHWETLDSPEYRLFYDFDDDKKVESRGTEAVLNALLFAGEDRHQKRQAPSPTTSTAFRSLWATQVLEGTDAGSWDWLDFGLAPWEAKHGRYFGATLAAIAVGEIPTDPDPAVEAVARPRVEALRHYLRRHRGEQDLHNRLWLLWASSALPGLVTADERAGIVAEVAAARKADGGWGLPSLVPCKRGDGTPQSTESDGYATGLVVHALRVSGSAPDQAEVARGLAWLRSNQRPDGSWVGRSLNKERKPETLIGHFMTDAATALAVLALTD